MLIVGAACCATGLLCWPGDRGTARVRCGAKRKMRGFAVPRPGGIVLQLGALALGFALGGFSGMLAAGLIGMTGLQRWRASRSAKGNERVLAALTDALGAIVGELRTGAHPAAAAESAAADCGAPIREMLLAIAAAARLGGNIGVALAHSAEAGPTVLRAQARGLAEAWRLSDVYGLPLAQVLAAVHRDVRHRLAFAAAVRARMAGPRSSAVVLALLPVLGVALGEGMGAAPLRVLLHTTAGGVLLVFGAGLTCAGVGITARLTGGGVR